MKQWRRWEIRSIWIRAFCLTRFWIIRSPSSSVHNTYTTWSKDRSGTIDVSALNLHTINAYLISDWMNITNFHSYLYIQIHIQNKGQSSSPIYQRIEAAWPYWRNDSAKSLILFAENKVVWNQFAIRVIFMDRLRWRGDARDTLENTACVQLRQGPSLE